MDSEVKYTDRFLKLNRDSSVEESKLAYDEMAPSWEKVYKCRDKWISVLWFRELYFPFLTYRKKILSAYLKVDLPLKFEGESEFDPCSSQFASLCDFPGSIVGNCPPTPPLTQG